MDKTIPIAAKERAKSQNNTEKRLRKEKLAAALRDNLRRRKIAASPASETGDKDYI